jgi:hypothetical protein
MKQLGVWKTPTCSIRRIRFDRESGHFLALLDGGRREQSIAAFNCDRNNLNHTSIFGSTGRVNDFCLSPQNSHLMTQSGDEFLFLDNKGQIIRRLNTSSIANEVHWGTDNLILATFPLSYPPAQLFHPDSSDAVDISPPLNLVSQHVPRAAISHDGNTIVFSHSFEKSHVLDRRQSTWISWQLSTCQIAQNVNFGFVAESDWFIRRFWFSRDDARIAIASYPRNKEQIPEMGLVFWDRSHNSLFGVPLDSTMKAIDLSSDFKLIAASYRHDPTSVGIWNAANGDLLTRYKTISLISDLLFSEDRSKLAVGGQGVFEVVDISSLSDQTKT